jgi:hypothetical protein
LFVFVWVFWNLSKLFEIVDKEREAQAAAS